MTSQEVIVTGAFDVLRTRQIRFLEEAAKLGQVTVGVWSDDVVEQIEGMPPKFSFAERVYFLEAIRFVDRVVAGTRFDGTLALPETSGFHAGIWADMEGEANDRRAVYARERGLDYRVIAQEQVDGFPHKPIHASNPERKKVVVTGCYDWLHSGHVRFFEEVSGYGELTVIVGHDANIRLLKGAGHPMISETERRYAVGSIKFVSQALISSGNGWLDADPEIRALKPDIYVVNEDGDQGGKREYCAKQGIEYLVLKRLPAPGLPKRTSTNLRGF